MSSIGWPELLLLLLLVLLGLFPMVLAILVASRKRLGPLGSACSSPSSSLSHHADRRARHAPAEFEAAGRAVADVYDVTRQGTAAAR